VALIVLDASVVIAHLDARDALHTQATEYLDSHAGDDFRLLLRRTPRSSSSPRVSAAAPISQKPSRKPGSGSNRSRRRSPNAPHPFGQDGVRSASRTR
jgi:hypothetical protein